MKVSAAAALNELRHLPPEQLLARASAVLPPWVAALLVVGLGWKLAQLTWALVPQGEALPVAPPPAPTPGEPAMAQANLPDRLQTIINQHLFGVYEESTAVVDTPPAGELPVAANYKLLGVLHSVEGVPSLAIIVDERGDAGVYGVGDALGRGAKLSSVEPTRVVIQRGANYEKLELPQEADTVRSGPVRMSRAASPRPRYEPSVGAAADAIADALGSVPAQLTELIRPQPVFADGKQLGYRVYPGRNRQQFTKLGLKPGDLVTQINGAPLDDPTRGLEVFRVLEEGSQVSVTVERDGQPQVIVVDAASLSSSLESGSEQ
jgi:general secretion pathway protein C